MTVKFHAPQLTGEQLLQLYADIVGKSIENAVASVLERTDKLANKSEVKNG